MQARDAPTPLEDEDRRCDRGGREGGSGRRIKAKAKANVRRLELVIGGLCGCGRPKEKGRSGVSYAHAYIEPAVPPVAKALPMLRRAAATRPAGLAVV